MAVQRLYKDAQVTIGPWIDRGFYYDFDIKEPLTDKDLKAIKKEMAKIMKANLPFIREEVRGQHATSFSFCERPFNDFHTGTYFYMFRRIGRCLYAYEYIECLMLA